MKDLITVLIPVYNAQNYIQECVESIFRSTYKNIEVLLLDDGSTDGSGKVCMELEQKYPKVKYEKLEHHGVSVTRNAGLTRANGEYIFFMDSDDAIHPQLIECLYENCIQNHASLAVPSRAIVESVVWKQKIKSDELCKELPNCTYCTQEETLYGFFWKNIALHSIGGAMIRKDIAQKVHFMENVFRGEDTLFIYHCILQGSDCVFLKKEWYYYRMHDQNATKVLNIASVENVYFSYKYIFDKEMSQGRTENAAHWMRRYAIALTHYYQLAKDAKNTTLQKYIRTIINRNQKEICIGMTPKERMRYVLCFRCYPLYYVVCKLYIGMRMVRTLIKR